MTFLRALIVGGLAALALAPAAAAAGRSSIGVQVSSIRGPIAQSDIDRDLDRVRSLGIRLVRVEVTWDALEPHARGQFDAATVNAVDRFMAGAARRRIKVMLTVDGTPCWASSAPAELRGDCSGDRLEASRYPPADPRDFVGVATFLAKRHAARLAAFEIWSEPDQRNELYWAGPDKVRRYVDLVRTVYAPLKQAAPRVQVLAGGFVGQNGRWLQAMYDAGIKGHYDMLSVHFYDLTLYALRTTRAVQRRNGDRSRLWLGETGWSSCSYRMKRQDGHVCVSRAAQARFTGDLVRTLRRARFVGGTVFYNISDSRNYDFGFFDHAGRMKPVARTIRTELRRRRAVAPRALRVRVRGRGGAIRLSGTAPAAEVYEVTVRERGFLRYRGFFRLTTSGRLQATLPAELGTRGVTVTVRSPFLKRQITRRL